MTGTPVCHMTTKPPPRKKTSPAPAPAPTRTRKPTAGKAAESAKPAKPAKPEKPEGSLKLVILGWYGVIGLLLSYVLPFRFPFAEGYAKEHWRHAVGSLLLALTFFIGLIVLATHLFDANDFKSQIVDYVKTSKQRELVLEGDIAVTFFPKLGLDTGRMRLSQRNSEAPFASVENARLYVAWWPLLRRQLQVERVVLDRLQANVVRNKDGSSNLDDLLEATDPLGSVRFEIDKMRVIESTVHYRDDASKIALSLHGVDMETGRLAEASAGKVQASARLVSVEPLINAQLQLTGNLLHDRATQRYQLDNMDLQAQGDAAGFSDLALTLRGTLTAKPTARLLSVANAQATAKGEIEQGPVDVRLSAALLQLDNRFFRANALTLDATVQRGKETLKASFEAPTLETDATALRSENVVASLSQTGGDLTLQAQFASPLSLEFANRHLEFGAVAGQWGMSHPLLASRLQAAVNGKLLARLPAQDIRLDFKTQLDESQISGSLQLQDFKSPAYVFDIVASTLDMDRYLVANWMRHLHDPALPFNFSALQGRKLHARLRSDTFTLARVKTRELSAELRVADGNFSIDTLQARLYGGNVVGSFTIENAETPRFTLRQKLTGVQVDTLLTDLLAGETYLSGKGQLAFDLEAQGQTLAALRQSLKGQASVNLQRGTLAGIDLVDALVAGKELVGIPSGERLDQLRLAETSDFSELRLNFEIAKGVARAEDALMKATLYTLRGDADYKIESRELDATLATTVAAGLKRDKAGELAELSGIRIPMRITGPWATANVNFELGLASGGNLLRLARVNQARLAAAAPETAETSK